MENITRKYKVYEFDELKKEIQEKVISEHFDFNVNSDYWIEDLREEFKEKLKDYGLSCNTFYWDIYSKGQFFLMDKVIIEDEKKFLNQVLSIQAKKDLMLNELQEDEEEELISIRIGQNSYSNFVENCEGIDRQTEENINELLEDINRDFLKRVYQEYDYLTSEESIKDSLKANDYKFLENGEVFN